MVMNIQGLIVFSVLSAYTEKRKNRGVYQVSRNICRQVNPFKMEAAPRNGERRPSH